jgi:Domain of unknown function (DUF4112)
MARTYDYDMGTGTFRSGLEGRAESRREALERLEWLAVLLDSVLVIPGTKIRFGADGLIGLIPGIGDAITSAISAYIVYEARRLGVPRHLLLRMIANVAIDGMVGAIPVAGDFFDVMFRANQRNVRLLRRHLEREGHV